MTRKWWNGLLVALLSLGLLTVSAFAQEKPGNGNGNGENGSMMRQTDNGDNGNGESMHGTAASEKSIVDTAEAASNCRTLCKLLGKAELLNTLRAKGPFTVFVPTDEAFSKLPAGTLDGLMADKGKLKDVLMYHVVPGKITAEQISQLDQTKAIDGKMIPISVTDQGVTVGGAKVLKADIMCGNGVIHVIDAVMIPQ